jgi:hypothetical protein
MLPSVYVMRLTFQWFSVVWVGDHEALWSPLNLTGAMTSSSTPAHGRRMLPPAFPADLTIEFATRPSML